MRCWKSGKLSNFEFWLNDDVMNNKFDKQSLAIQNERN